MLPATLLTAFRSLQWGAWCLVSLYVSLVSGVIVGLQYDLHEPFYSVSAIDLLVPYGGYFRSLHFYSSQLFFFTGCLHLLATHDKSATLDTGRWLSLVLSLPIALILLFTGYVLRGDNTGYSAGMIAEAILRAIPLIGELANDLLFAVSGSGMQRVYLHHVISFDLLLLILCWDHLRRYRVRLTDQLPLLCLLLAFSVAVTAPLEPDRLGITYISGPWFFLGLQELLRYLHPLVAGVIVPLSFLAALLFWRPGNRYFRGLSWFLSGWLVLYAGFTLVAWLR